MARVWWELSEHDLDVGELVGCRALLAHGTRVAARSSAPVGRPAILIPTGPHAPPAPDALPVAQVPGGCRADGRTRLAHLAPATLLEQRPPVLAPGPRGPTCWLDPENTTIRTLHGSHPVRVRGEYRAALRARCEGAVHRTATLLVLDSHRVRGVLGAGPQFVSSQTVIRPRCRVGRMNRSAEGRQVVSHGNQTALSTLDCVLAILG
jgi:hypothetical protein